MAVVDNGSTVYSAYKLENENDWEKKSKGTKMCN